MNSKARCADVVRLFSGETHTGGIDELRTVSAGIEEGDDLATAEQLLVLVYDDLRRLAASKLLATGTASQTLQPTSLVHEAWLRLVGDQNPSFKDRTHFFRASAETMRHILIDRARQKRTQRHGGAYRRVDLEDFDLTDSAHDEQLLAVNDSLDKLALDYPVQAELVKLRYFVGMTNEEVGEVLGISISTVKNYWTFARAWLHREIRTNNQAYCSRWSGALCQSRSSLSEFEDV
ncbi:MAG TPA: ECF-type sigma factor [Verrucomicrobiae bacterium]|nr:ECF-type sigma factor [Verrucomicrobiae bacterium]